MRLWPEYWPRFRIRPIFAWYDLWMGVYIDRYHETVYIFILPMIGIRIEILRS